MQITYFMWGISKFLFHKNQHSSLVKGNLTPNKTYLRKHRSSWTKCARKHSYIRNRLLKHLDNAYFGKSTQTSPNENYKRWEISLYTFKGRQIPAIIERNICVRASIQTFENEHVWKGKMSAPFFFFLVYLFSLQI